METNWHETEDGVIDVDVILSKWLEIYGGYDSNYNIYNAIKIKNIQTDSIRKLAYKFRMEGYTDKDQDTLTDALLEKVKCADPDRLKMVRYKFRFHIANSKKGDYDYGFKENLWVKREEKEKKKAAKEESKEYSLFKFTEKESILERIARLSKGG
jgi:hypothetical protein